MPKVLLVNTPTFLQQLLERRFVQEGFEVFTSADGVVSLQESPDLIVVGQGEEAAVNKLISERPWASVPVILLTTGERDERADELLEHSQLKMPFRPSQLVEMVRKTVG